MKVTLVPEQTGLAEATIVTLTGSVPLTIMFTVLEVAGLPVGHEMLEVRIQVIKSPSDEHRHRLNCRSRH